MSRAARRGRHRRRAPLPAAQVFEGHGAARRPRAGAAERSGGRVPRRADVRPRPDRPARSARIILRLRDRGSTVFFSSHILQRRRDAVQPRGDPREGRLVAAGTVAEMVPFRDPRLGFGRHRACSRRALRRGSRARVRDVSTDRRRPLSPRAAGATSPEQRWRG